MHSKYLYAAFAAALAGFAFSAAAQAKCSDAYNWKYGNGRTHKAFAMTGPASALVPTSRHVAFSCGWSVNQPTRAVAVKLALAICESERARNDRRSACHIVKSQ